MTSRPAAPEKPEIAMPIAEQWDGQTYYTDANGRVVGQQECIVKLNHYWRQLALALTEIKGHMRTVDDLKHDIARHLAICSEQTTRIAALEKERDELKHHIAVTEALKDRA